MSDSSWRHSLYSARLLCPRGFLARILEWGSISYSRGSFWPWDGTATLESPASQADIISDEESPAPPRKPQVTAAAAAKSLHSCLTLCDPLDGSPSGTPIPGILQQEHWSGLSFPSPVCESEKWKWSRSVVSDSLHPMGCSPPGSSIHGIFQARVLEWDAIAFSGNSY